MTANLLDPRVLRRSLCGLVLAALTLAQAPAQYTQLSTNPSSLLFGVVKLETELPAGPGWAM